MGEKMKTQLTKDIEKKLIERSLKWSQAFATEVVIENDRHNKSGIVDFIEINFANSKGCLPIINCYEIKVSYEDYKSKNGHNLVGDFNCYVFTRDLYEKVKMTDDFNLKVGVIIYENGKLETVRYPTNGFYASPYPILDLSLEERFKILQSVLNRWTRGGMTRTLFEYGIELPSETYMTEEDKEKMRLSIVGTLKKEGKLI